jgi:hypothetical protein
MMVAPLQPQQTEQALALGSQAEIDEFHRLVEQAHLAAMSPNIMKSKDRERLTVLRNKLFPSPVTKPPRSMTP